MTRNGETEASLELPIGTLVGEGLDLGHGTITQDPILVGVWKFQELLSIQP